MRRPSPSWERKLLRLVKQSGRKVEHGVEIDFPISRQDIAQMTCTTARCGCPT
jgi:hypothetical protein